MSGDMPEDPFAESINPDTDDDPFADAVKAPAVSFNQKPIGTEIRFEVTRKAQMVQQRHYESGELLTWDDGNPKMAAVFKGTVDGEPRSLWAPKPSALFNAIGEAQAGDGKGRIDSGAVLYVKLSGEKPVTKNGKKMNPQKLYEVRLER